MDRNPATEQSTENPFCPQGWTEDDCKRAAMEWDAFKGSQAYHWLGHYLGAKERQLHWAMATKKPSALSHVEYVELGARANEIQCFWQAMKVLTSYENTERSPISGTLEETQSL